MDRDTVIRLARQVWSAGEVYIGPPDDQLTRFAALVEDHLKQQGYRQCAKGQRTTQFCGMLEQAIRDEREACAKVADEHAAYWAGYKIAAAIRSRT